METNPFKFGQVVDGLFFTDREEELALLPLWHLNDLRQNRKRKIHPDS